jgi:hypothetical protein
VGDFFGQRLGPSKKLCKKKLMECTEYSKGYTLNKTNQKQIAMIIFTIAPNSSL